MVDEISSEVPVAGPIDTEHVEGWVWGTGLDDAENCTLGSDDVYATREEAIADGEKYCGWRGRDEGFQTAWKRWGNTDMPNHLDAMRAVEDAENEEFGEAMLEQWRDKAFSDATHPTIGKTPMEDLERAISCSIRSSAAAPPARSPSITVGAGSGSISATAISQRRAPRSARYSPG